VGLEASDVSGSARVALLGETVARRLFGEDDPLGQEVLIGPVRFRVVGLLEPFGTDIHGLDRDAEVVVPISTLMRRVLNVDTIGGAKILLADPARVEPAAGELKRLLRARHALASGAPDDFALITSSGVQRTLRQVERTLFVFLPLAAGVILLASAAVAASLTLASVAARTGEIGLRRAVGARPSDIQAQFLLESALTSLAGGLLGLAAGGALALWVAERFTLGSVFSWTAIFAGLAASLATGLLAGVLPARRAARREPSEALR
jgi:putative ABC transport system permease protein